MNSIVKTTACRVVVSCFVTALVAASWAVGADTDSPSGEARLNGAPMFAWQGQVSDLQANVVMNLPQPQSLGRRPANYQYMRMTILGVAVITGVEPGQFDYIARTGTWLGIKLHRLPYP